MAAVTHAVVERLLMPKATNPSTAIFIAFGGNIGDVQAHFCSARTAIAQLNDTQLTASSKLYRTPPLGPDGQDDYYNAVIAIQSHLKILKLLHALQDIEHQHHRVRKEHWGPRTLDLDIIASQDHIINSDQLIVPHKELQHRQFVLRPLCDIAPNWQHPVLKKTTTQLLQALLQTGEQALPEGIQW